MFQSRPFQTWQLVLGVAVSVLSVLLLGLIGRSIYYAVNPDKRPLKRKPRR
jgi:hypothetical protein